jgi:hypothetical protein
MDEETATCIGTLAFHTRRQVVAAISDRQFHPLECPAKDQSAWFEHEGLLLCNCLLRGVRSKEGGEPAGSQIDVEGQILFEVRDLSTKVKVYRAGLVRTIRSVVARFPRSRLRVQDKSTLIQGSMNLDVRENHLRRSDSSILTISRCELGRTA